MKSLLSWYSVVVSPSFSTKDNICSAFLVEKNPLLGIFRNIIRRKRLTDFFEDSFCPDDIISSVLYLRNNLLYEIDNHNCQSNLTKGISFMFPDPKSGSALKRIFMFLRWMVRKDAIDFGILKKIKTSELIIPLDTHTANIGRLLDMTSRKTNDLRCAIEITDFLRKLEPDDPIRYDFAIAHIGITEGCRHSYNKIVCKDCILSAFCDNRQL
ncbi:MAG: TIGR02757 family protein [Deltaproteobacteria bacterium]|nr:TIGR02757 family protein [Deltaproteobacteria bacterium]